MSLFLSFVDSLSMSSVSCPFLIISGGDSLVDGDKKDRVGFVNLHLRGINCILNHALEIRGDHIDFFTAA